MTPVRESDELAGGAAPLRAAHFAGSGIQGRVERECAGCNARLELRSEAARLLSRMAGERSRQSLRLMALTPAVKPRPMRTIPAATDK